MTLVSSRLCRHELTGLTLFAATVDEHLQYIGAEAFYKFQRTVNGFDRVLRNFSNAARQLGSSIAILSSSYHLRTRLAHLLFLFRENAACLFPRRISRPRIDGDTESSSASASQTRKTRTVKVKGPHHVARPTVTERLDAEDFPKQLELLATDLTTFLDCLNDFPEFTDEAVNTAIRAFERDLKYLSSCLIDYEGQFKCPAVQQYLHDLSSDLGEHIQTITSTLSIFIDVGVPSIRFAQRHGAENLLNLSTVATFFSAVTATTLQYSYQYKGDPVANATNTLWFASLVFSIAAAVNSLVGLTWKQAMYRSPGHRVPWWVLIWIKRSPLVFLVFSVGCFSIGLCCFAYASDQASVTSTITTVTTVLSNVGLTAVSAWFATERYIYVRHRGRKWLGDVLDEAKEQAVQVVDGKRVQRFRIFLREQGGAIALILYRLKSRITSLKFSRPNLSCESCDLEANSIPASETPQEIRDIYANGGPMRLPKRRDTTSSQFTHFLEKGDDTNLEFSVQPVEHKPVLPPRFKEVEDSSLPGIHRSAVRHTKFSPDGRYLVTSSWDRKTVIFRVGESITPHHEIVHHQGFVGQLAWSPFGNMLLTKIGRSVEVWSAEDGARKAAFDRDINVDAISWFPRANAFATVEGNKVTKFSLDGSVLYEHSFERLKLQDIAILPDSQRFVGIGCLRKSPTGLKPTKSKAEKRIFVFDIENRRIECQRPLHHDIRDIHVGRARDGLVALVNFDKAPPQLWRVELFRDPVDGTVRTNLNLKYTLLLKPPADTTGPSAFAGRNNQYVLSPGRGGNIYVWDQETGALMHQYMRPVHFNDMISSGVTWNNGAEDAMFATGSQQGDVLVWTGAKPSC
ncbi:hypothetical protein AMATHDRAFT_146529 [Amanita thiersii Skay4041]|uniref:Uncharacterized protein n=1 Tax=Amanita thiersii Skay4041 TaxID=703135 RepID=A0A2A9NIK1_9AGAR|nr:hypothetical protein AMATHDRAFT_146529 [Amanita thiersii Skay4041]